MSGFQLCTRLATAAVCVDPAGPSPSATIVKPLVWPPWTKDGSRPLFGIGEWNTPGEPFEICTGTLVCTAVPLLLIWADSVRPPFAYWDVPHTNEYVDVL